MAYGIHSECKQLYETRVTQALGVCWTCHDNTPTSEHARSLCLKTATRKWYEKDYKWNRKTCMKQCQVAQAFILVLYTCISFLWLLFYVVPVVSGSINPQPPWIKAFPPQQTTASSALAATLACAVLRFSLVHVKLHPGCLYSTIQAHAQTLIIPIYAFQATEQRWVGRLLFASWMTETVQ